MAITKEKGDLGESMIMADVLMRGHKVAIPVGEDWKFDLIVLRKGKLERVQCKFVTPKDGVLLVPCRSCNSKTRIRYTDKDIDWMAVFDSENKKCYYISSKYIGSGRAFISLRLDPPKNKQKREILLAKNFEKF